MKKTLSGLLILSLLVIAQPTNAADEKTRDIIGGMLSSIQEVILAVASYLNIQTANEYALSGASLTGQVNSKSKAVGPIVGLDIVPAKDGPGVFEGELQVVSAEDYDTLKSQNFYYLHDKSTGIVLEMKPDKQLPPGLVVGAKLRAVGNVKSGKMDVKVGAAAGSTGSLTLVSTSTVALPATVATVTKKALAIIINTSDAVVNCTPAKVSGILFTNTGNNVAEAFYSASYGQVAFTGDVVGPYTVSLTASDSYSLIGNAGQVAAQAAGIDLTTYDHIINVIPDNPTNSYAGYGRYNSNLTWIYNCALPDVYQHELGHNLGLGHANRDAVEYNDRGSFMGFSGVGLRHTEAAHMDYLNWLTDASILVNPPSGRYTLSSSDIPSGSVSSPQAIILSKADTNQRYYISYRTPVGYANKMPAEYDYKTQIHVVSSNNTAGTDFKFLSPTTPYVDSANGLSITLVSTSTTAVIVDIGSVCTTNPPTLSVSPIEIGSRPGGAVQYAVSVKNNNSAFCGVTPVNLSVSDTSINLNTSLSTTLLNLASGATGSVVVSATSDTAITSGTQSITTVAKSGTSQASVVTKYTIDLIAPSIPLNVSASVSQKQINVTWNAATDNVSVTGYEILRNGVVIGTTQTTSFADKLPVSGTNTYQVRAKDAAGNTSGLSNSASVSYGNGGGGRRK